MEDTNDKIWTVYVHIVPKNIRQVDNDKYYVGITKQEPERRWQNGYGYKGQYFYRAIEKYGWENIKHEIVSDNLTESEAKELEKELIKKFNTRDHNCGYNCTDGGDGCINLSPEARERVGNAQRGKIVSEETRRKLSESHSRVIYQFDLNGTFLREWKGTSEIQQELGYKKTNISTCCLRKSSQAYGFLWSYDKNDHMVYKNLRKRPVQQYDTQGNFIKEYESANEAERQTGANSSNIASCCNKKLKSAGGYQWKYSDDDCTINKIKFNYKTKKVRQLTLDGSFIVEFDSTCEASRITGVNQQHISDVCLNRRKTAGGYKWEYVYNDSDETN